MRFRLIQVSLYLYLYTHTLNRCFPVGGLAYGIPWNAENVLPLAEV
jgi:hypothetical protein